jgi:hypothetical protein
MQITYQFQQLRRHKPQRLKPVFHFARIVPKRTGEHAQIEKRFINKKYIKIKSSSQVNFLAYYGSTNQSTFTKFWNLKTFSLRYGTVRYGTGEVENRLNNCPLKGGFPVLARSSSQLAASDAWALSSNHNAKRFILIRCKHSQRAARSFVRGLEIRLKTM